MCSSDLSVIQGPTIGLLAKRLGLDQKTSPKPSKATPISPTPTKAEETAT